MSHHTGNGAGMEALEANNPELETIHLFSESTPGDTVDGAHMMEEAGASTIFGDYYVGSFSLGLYTTAGMIAGEAAAAELNG